MSRTRVAILGLIAVPYVAQAGTDTGSAAIDGLRERGKIVEAVAAGRSAVARDPDDADVRLALARALAASARQAQLRPGAKTTTPVGDGMTVELPGASRMEIGYQAAPFEEALVHLAEAIRRSPARADLRMFQCFLLTDGARVERAAAAIREAAEALPYDPSLPSDLARFGAERAKRGDLSGAVRLLGVVASRFPEDAAVQADHGMALAHMGRVPDALAALERAVAADPTDIAVRRKRATVALTLREFGKAEESYRAAFDLSRDESDRVGAAAAAYALDPERGASLFGEMSTAGASAPPGLAELASDFQDLSRSPTPARSELALARELRRRGHPLLAIPLLQRCLERGGETDEARRELAAVYTGLGMPVLAERALSGR